MIGAALDRIFREASGRIVAALAARFRDLATAEDAFSEACTRALEVWPQQEMPRDPAAWLYQVAVRAALDALRRRRTQERFASWLGAEQESAACEPEVDGVIPDERLRLIFICCHPAVAVDSRAALTLRLVCGLSTREIARAFLVSEAAMAQRLSRAKQKIADAGVPFEVPAPDAWPERMAAVLSTLEVAYAKAHEDAAGSGPHAHYAAEMIVLSRTLAELLPADPDVAALAALVRFAEARRPARLEAEGCMVPLAEQNPAQWIRPLIEEGMRHLERAAAFDPDRARVVQARIHAAWCSRASLAEPPPWDIVLGCYDELLALRDDPVVRLNRAVAVAETRGVEAALRELGTLDDELLRDFAPYHAVRADLLRRAGQPEAAGAAYDRAIGLVGTAAERAWLERQRQRLEAPGIKK
jgi:RNA polymerase sigma-70 factor (ECF subfamily)